MRDVSLLRLYVLRALYLCIVFVPGAMAMRSLFAPDEALGVLQGVAFSFWGALGLLALFGLRYPLRMLPLLMLQMIYKALWLFALVAPQVISQEPLTSGMARYAWIMGLGVAADLLVIPWPYVWAQYMKSEGDPWAPSKGG